MEEMGVTHMAGDRFLFWRSFYDALLLLDDASAGRLTKAMCAYAFDEEETDLSDTPALRLAWAMVSGEIRESVEKGRRDAENGRRSGEARRSRAGKQKREPPSEPPSEGASNVSKYVSTSSGYAPSLTAPALAAESPEPPAPRDPEEDLRAAHAVLAAMEAIESEERRARGGDG
jgi:hypothetical protein